MTGHIVIEIAEINVCKPLARQIADRKSTSSTDRGEQIVSGKPVRSVILLITRINNQIAKIEDALIRHHISNFGLEDLMVYARKKLRDVALE